MPVYLGAIKYDREAGHTRQLAGLASSAWRRSKQAVTHPPSEIHNMRRRKEGRENTVYILRGIVGAVVGG